MRRFTPPRNPRPAERGQSLMEFALVIPVLMMLFMGIMDFGRMMFLYSQLSNGAREAARFGSVIGTNPLSPQFLQCTNIENAVTSLFGLQEPVTTTIQYDDGRDLQFGGAVCSAAIQAEEIESGSRIRVTATSDFVFLTPLVEQFLPSVNVSFTAARTILIGGTRVPDGWW